MGSRKIDKGVLYRKNRRMLRNQIVALILLLNVNSHGALSVKKGDYIGSGGVGLTLSPTLFMISPQLEYVYESTILFGLLSQFGFGGDGVIFTGTGTGRLLFAPYGKVQPCVEGGLGFTLASAIFPQSVGVHILLGFGADYDISKTTSIGTMIRLNFVPPLKPLIVSWPLIIGRFVL